MRLDTLVADGVVETGVRLGALTTYKLGGPARWFAEVEDAGTLERVLAAAEGVPLLVLGRGSNLVVADDGFDGLVVRLAGEYNRIEHLPEVTRAGGAVPLPVLARSAVAEGRLGLEFYVGIPGSVGGAIRQNAGCHGSETKDVLVAAEVMGAGGVQRRLDAAALELSYRHSNVVDTDVVVSADFAFRPGPPVVGEEEMRAVVRWRKDHQPGGTLNAGSVFKNPAGDAAGRIIDALGLKGLRVGGASVSQRHANFFVADPDATASDVYRLVRLVQARVLESTGVLLEPEIRFAGRFQS